MITDIGTRFPLTYQYGPKEFEIWSSTRQQIQQHFPNSKNLYINTTWFGPQFDNGEWQKLVQALEQDYDNLFMLATIDPVYITEQQIDWIYQQSGASHLYKIGTWENSDQHWNWHAGCNLIPNYAVDQVVMQSAKHVYLCYQRKPRAHRIELTNLLTSSGLDSKGIYTLGAGCAEEQDWSQGLTGQAQSVGDNLSDWEYADIGREDRFAGLPNDVVSLGNLDIWQNHFLNVVSETEFDEWRALFITEKTWKPMIGMRPYVIHGQTRVYEYLESAGFKTFTEYWPYTTPSDGQHEHVMSVLHYLCDMSQTELESLYQLMLPDLQYNRERFIEFSQQQYRKMHNVFAP